MPSGEDFFSEDDLIHSYTRAEAIADGELIDVTGSAIDAGFRCPVALTRATWEGAVALPRDYEGQFDEVQRLTSLLSAAYRAISLAAIAKSDTAVFAFPIYNATLKTTEPLALKACCSPGDDAEPVIIIMLPDES